MYGNKIRCRYYDSQGRLSENPHPYEPSQCRFVHPDSPAWATASHSPNFPKMGSSRPPRRRSEFSQAAWAPDAPGTSTNTILLPQGPRSQGNAKPSQSQAKTINEPTKDIAPGSTTDDNFSWSSLIENSDTVDNSWGSNAAPAWGKTNQTAWGETVEKEAPKASSSAVPAKKNTGFGSTGTGWGDMVTDDDANAPWGSGGTGWGKGINDDKGKGKQTDVTMRDPSPLPVNVSRPVPSQSQTKKQTQDLPRLDSNVQAHTASFSPNTPNQPMSAIYSPLSAGAESAHLVSGMLDFLLGGGDQHKVSRSGASTPTSVSSMSKYQGYEGRVRLVRDEVVFQLEAVIHQIALLRAQVEDARWKRTQVSAAYSRSTLRTRDIMQAHRNRFAAKVDQAKKNRDRALKRLSNLPELPSITDKVKNPAKIEELVLAYTSELKEWFEDLELHKRILLEKIANEETNIEGSEDGQSEDVCLRSLLDQEKWTWKELQRAVSLLGTAITNTVELIYEKAYTKADEPEDLGPMLAEKLAPIVPDIPMPDFSDELSQLEDNLNTTGQKIEGDATRAGDLIMKISSLKAEIERLRAERMRMDSIYVEAEKQLADFDQRTVTDATEIQELTEMIKNLHLHKRASKSPTPTELTPAKINDILGHIRPFVIQRIKDDLTTIYENLCLRCKENQESVADEVDVMLKPILTKTEEILATPVQPIP